MLLSISLVFCQFQPGVAYESVIKQNTYNIMKPFGTMFRRKVRPEEMKRYTLLGCTDQANVRFVKDRIFARALQRYLSHCQKKVNQADMQND